MKKFFSTLLLSAVVMAPVGFSVSAVQAATAKTHQQTAKAHTAKASNKTHHAKSSHSAKSHKSNTAMNKK